ncbi:hypothetical protein GTG23_04760 [Rhodococcus hoagii]|nr:hypothetical protein [Prescottella equi]
MASHAVACRNAVRLPPWASEVRGCGLQTGGDRLNVLRPGSRIGDRGVGVRRVDGGAWRRDSRVRERHRREPTARRTALELGTDGGAVALTRRASAAGAGE